jgi:hypothetical protein
MDLRAQQKEVLTNLAVFISAFDQLSVSLDELIKNIPSEVGRDLWLMNESGPVNSLPELVRELETLERSKGLRLPLNSAQTSNFVRQKGNLVYLRELLNYRRVTPAIRPAPVPTPAPAPAPVHHPAPVPHPKPAVVPESGSGQAYWVATSEGGYEVPDDEVAWIHQLVTALHLRAYQPATVPRPGSVVFYFVRTEARFGSRVFDLLKTLQAQFHGNVVWVNRIGKTPSNIQRNPWFNGSALNNEPFSLEIAAQPDESNPIDYTGMKQKLPRFKGKGVLDLANAVKLFQSAIDAAAKTQRTLNCRVCRKLPLSVCTCNHAQYCSLACQKVDWPAHKAIHFK